MIHRGTELSREAAHSPGGWVGKRQFELAAREVVCVDISRFTFKPVDGEVRMMVDDGWWVVDDVRASRETHRKAFVYRTTHEQHTKTH